MNQEKPKTFAEALAEVKLTPTKLTFGEHLRAERERMKRGVYDMAKGISVPQERYRAFEEGEASPTRAEYHRICKQLRSMRFHEPEPVAASARDPRPELTLVRPPRVEPLPEPKHRPKAKTFGEALRQERELEDVTPQVVADCLGVSRSAVTNWEDDFATPVLSNYEKLLDLFPRLASAPRPPSRAIEVPTGHRHRSALGVVTSTLGHEEPEVEAALKVDATQLFKDSIEDDTKRELAQLARLAEQENRTQRQHMPPSVRAVLQAVLPPAPVPPPPKDPMLQEKVAPAAPAPSAETLTEKAISLLETLRGGRWALSYERAAKSGGFYQLSAWKVSEQDNEPIQVEGEGARGAARALLKLLSSELDRESASLRQQAEKTASELRRRAEALDALKVRGE